MERNLMKGNEALAEAAIRAGCKCFFGYPITPQTEISAYMAKRMPKIGGVFLQAESEVAAINMVYGAGGAGKRKTFEKYREGGSPGAASSSISLRFAGSPGGCVGLLRGKQGAGTGIPFRGTGRAGGPAGKKRLREIYVVEADPTGATGS